MAKPQKTVYCSLDIEGTGLDPKKDAIIEVGAVLFEFDKDGEIKFGEEFSQLVKSPIPIPPFIQDLTGITEADLENAPAWEEVRPKFKKFVGRHPIVGQNIQFDLNFLAANGLDFIQPSIDTKELAQIFLPHARFFGLEYLLRYFNVPLVSHHRALDDSKSAALLLQQIILSTQRLPKNVQKDILRLLKASSLPFKELFYPGSAPAASVLGRQGRLFGEDSGRAKPAAIGIAPPERIFSAPGTFLVNLPLVLWRNEIVKSLMAASSRRDGGVVLVADLKAAGTEAKFAADDAWTVLDEPENYFCAVRFEQFLLRKKFSDPEASFLIKVLVWLATKKETEELSSLPLIGPDYFFKEMICGNFSICPAHKPACAFAQILSRITPRSRVLLSPAAWLKYSAVNPGQEFERLLFLDAGALEKTGEEMQTQTVTLKSARAIVSALYDPAADSGALAGVASPAKKIFEAALNRLDLTFGLWSLNFSEGYFGIKPPPPLDKLEAGYRGGFDAGNVSAPADYLKLGLHPALCLAKGGVHPRGKPWGIRPNAISQRVADEEFRVSEAFSKMAVSAENLAESLTGLEVLAEKIPAAHAPETVRLLEKLKAQRAFFEEFFLRPQPADLCWFDFFDGKLKLKKRPKTIKLPAARARAQGFFGNFGVRSLKAYFGRLLNGEDFEEIKIGFSRKPAVEVWLPRNFPRPNAPQANLAITESLKRLFPRLSGRTLVLFNSQNALEAAFRELAGEKLKPRLLAQRISGHQWKNLEAFQNDPDAIWLATSQNFTRRTEVLPEISQLVIVRIPYETLGVLESCYDPDSAFGEVVMPRTIMRLDRLWQSFILSGETVGDNKKIFFFDSRITEEFNEEILNALSCQFATEFFEFEPDD